MNEEISIKEKTFSSIFWKLSERFGAQLVSFVVQIILARLLLPEEFGIVAIVNVFISLCNVLVTNGFGTALIQKKDAREIDFSSVLIFNFVLSLLLYWLMFFMAPVISRFYENEELTILIRILCLQIPLSGIKTVQQAFVARKLKFRLFFRATLIGTVISGIIGIVLAYRGAGVMALVIQYLANSAIDVLILALTIGLKFRFAFSWIKLKPLIRYGWKILASALINSLYNEMQTLVIGKVYTKEDLAYYNRGKQFPDLITGNITVSIESVLFPVMSNYQNDVQMLQNIAGKFIKVCSYIVFPLLLGLAVVADSLVSIVLTEKWLFCVPYIRIFCIANIFAPIQAVNLQSIKACGRSDIFLKLEIIKKSIGFLILIVSVQFGVVWIAIGLSAYSIIASIINSIPNKKLLHYSYWHQIKDLSSAFFASLFMGVIVFLIGYIPVHEAVKLTIQIITGVIVYLIISIIFKMEGYSYLLKTIRNLLKRNKNKTVEENCKG